MNRLSAGLRLALFTLFYASAVFAQRDLSTLVGTVTDASGGVIANAKVVVTETGTGLVYNLTTNEGGEFSRPALKPSTYSVTVSAPGFRTAEQRDILLKAGDRTGVNIALTIGDVGQTVEVSAAAPLLQTESTHVGAAINEKILTDVPLGGQRNFAYLARLSPGVLPAEPGARDSSNGGFSAGGVRSNGQNNFLLNGVDNNVNTIDFLNQTSYSVGPSVEAIGEMSIMTNGFNAEYGRAAGAVINVNLKSGSNQLRGSLFEILQNKDLNANSWTNNTVGKPRGPFIQNQFGATAGGPLKKNKLFMFGDYQGTRIASSGGIQGLGFLNSNATIPTADMKLGNFSSLLGATATGQDSNGNAIQFIKGQLYDPASGVGANPTSRTPFVGNIIPTSRFDPAFSKLMQQFPATNQPIITGSQPTGDYFYNTAGSQVTDQGDGRVDYRLTDKDSLFGSISWGNTNRTSVAPFPGALDNSGFNGVGELDLSRNAQISYTRVWTPTMVSETRASFTRLVTSRVGANPDADLFAAFGIGGYNPTKNYTGNGGLPYFTAAQATTTNSYTSFGGAQWSPTLEYNNVWDFVQNFAISKNSHSIKIGAEFRQVKFPFFQVPSPHGLVAYNSNQTAYPSTKASSLGPQVGASTGDPIASALLGQIDNGQVSTTNFISSQKNAWAGYFQDDWKVTRKLTVNMGVRYELLSPIGERFARQANFDMQTMTLYIPKGKQQDLPLPPNFATSYPNVKVDRGSVSNYLIPWDKLDFGPRIGMAYAVDAKTVIRAGYGIFYGGEENQGGNPNRGEGIPFNETVNLVRTPGAVSQFVGVTDPNCTGCNFMPGGLTGGFPASPFTLNAAIQFRGVQPDFRNPLVHKWNVIVQRELPQDMAVEIGYEGNHQAHQLTLGNTDTYPNLGTTNPALQGTSGADTLRYINAACPTCASVGTGLQMTVSNGFGNYAAGSVKLEKRFTHGLQFLTAYTWSHALANAGTSLSGSSNLGYPDPTNWASGYSSASWDIRHSYTNGFNYDLPFGKDRAYGKNMNRGLDAIAGGWHANGLLSLRTGVAYTLIGTCQGVWGRCEPDVIPGVSPNQAPPGGRTPGQWFDIASFRIAAPLTGGNLGLQSMTGPPTRTLDFSMFKDISFTERCRLQFRAEATNLTNSNQFSIPTSQNVADAKAFGGNGNFGKIVSTVAGTERRVQFQLRLSF
ncbi:MAG TPA: TonB-dependent receptor [Bryobacteraceae bacterium]|nr:TonB-dependent receptor [Bryobacteraceae bacterium]